MSEDGDKFDFDKHCIFCPIIAERILPAEYPKCVPRQKHKPAYKFRTVKYKDSKDYKEHIYRVCRERSDKLGQIVKSHLDDLIDGQDLHAADARY